MSSYELEAFATQMIRALNAQDVNALGQMFGVTDEDWDSWARSLHAFYRAFPDYTAQVEKVVAGTDAVAIFYRVTATHAAEYPAAELERIPPTNRKVTWHEAQWIVLREGRAVHSGLVVSGVERLQQLGVLPVPTRMSPV